MQILQVTNKKLTRAKVISFVGCYIAVFGVIYSFAANEMRSGEYIILSGVVITLIGLFYGLNFITCPRCDYNLGKSAYFHSNIRFKLKASIEKCPFCNLFFTRQVNEDLYVNDI